jgi:hypothetical protein
MLGVSACGRKIFPAPSLDMVSKVLLITAVHSTKTHGHWMTANLNSGKPSTACAKRSEWKVMQIVDKMMPIYKIMSTYKLTATYKIMSIYNSRSVIKIHSRCLKIGKIDELQADEHTDRHLVCWPTWRSAHIARVLYVSLPIWSLEEQNKILITLRLHRKYVTLLLYETSLFVLSDTINFPHTLAVT